MAPLELEIIPPLPKGKNALYNCARREGGRMPKIWHEEAFAQDAYKLADKAFIKSLKSYSLTDVLRGTALVWTQLVIGFVLPFFSLWLIPVSIVIMASVQQQMATWVHESSHHNLFRDHAANDLWCNLFFASPIAMNVQGYRKGHLTHHAYLSTDDDLDSHVHGIDLNGPHLWRELGKMLIGYYGVKVAVEKYLPVLLGRCKSAEGTDAATSPMPFLAMTAMWNGVFLAICVVGGVWYVYFLIWVYPLFSITQAINIIRTTAEHQPEGFPGTPLAEEPLVRTTLPGPVERWFMYGVSFNYHLEHHLWPHIPFFSLPKLHRHLVEKGFYNLYPSLLQRSGIIAVWHRTRRAPARVLATQF